MENKIPENNSNNNENKRFAPPTRPSDSDNKPVDEQKRFAPPTRPSDSDNKPVDEQKRFAPPTRPSDSDNKPVDEQKRFASPTRPSGSDNKPVDEQKRFASPTRPSDSDNKSVDEQKRFASPTRPDPDDSVQTNPSKEESSLSDQEWYFNSYEGIKGPYTFDSLLELHEFGGDDEEGIKGYIKPDQLLRKGKEGEWHSAYAFPEFEDMYREKFGQLIKACFSNEPINVSHPSANAKTSFNPGERIYGLFMFEGPLKNFFQFTATGEGKLEAKASIGMNSPSSSFSTVSFRLTNEDIDNHYVLFDVYPDPANARTLYEWEHTSVSTYLAQLKPGKHMLQFTMGKNYEEVMAADITIDLTGMNASTIKNEAKLAYANAEKSFVSGRKLPKEFFEPSVAIPDLTEDEIKKLITDDFGAIKNIKKITVTGNPRWTVSKNELGIPQSLYLDYCNVMVLYEAESGECFFWEKVYIDKPYLGGSSYGAPQYGGGRPSLTPGVKVPCNSEG